MGIADDVTPQSPVEKQPVIGLIGMGAMGTMYAQQLADAGWKKYVLLQPNSPRSPLDGLNRIYVCDLPSKYDALKEKYKGASLHRLSSYLALLAYFSTPRCPIHYCFTRWSPRLEIRRLHYVFRRGRVHR